MGEFLLQGTPKDPDNFPFIVIGNKIDKEQDRKIDQLKAKQWAKNHGDLEYFETSAKENKNVEETFTAIAKAAASHDSDEIFFPEVKKVTLKSGGNSGNNRNPHNKKKCC